MDISEIEKLLFNALDNRRIVIIHYKSGEKYRGWVQRVSRKTKPSTVNLVVDNRDDFNVDIMKVSSVEVTNETF